MKRVGICWYLIKWDDRVFTRHINQLLRTGEKDGRQNEKPPEGVPMTWTRTDTESGEEEGNDIQLPPRDQWAEIIGVPAPQEMNYDRMEGPSSLGTKRPRSSSPGSPQPTSKFYKCDDPADAEGQDEYRNDN